MRRLLLFIFCLLLYPVLFMPNMSDEQVVEYVKNAQASRKIPEANDY